MELISKPKILQWIGFNGLSGVNDFTSEIVRAIIYTTDQSAMSVKYFEINVEESSIQFW